jgi:hypothetical protein
MAIPWKPAVSPKGCFSVIAYREVCKMHHTKDKGDLGVLKAQIDLYEQGFMILNPLTEHAAFDLVAYKSGKFHRVQVQYRKLDKFGNLDVKFSTCWTDRHGTHTVPIDRNEVDLFYVYCPDTDECYYFEPAVIGSKSSVSLRVETPKNGQKLSIRLACDHRRAP